MPHGLAGLVLVFSAMFVRGLLERRLVMTLYSFFWNATSLPQFGGHYLYHLKQRVARYARIRVWGSIGFIATVVVLGVLVEHQGPGGDPAVGASDLCRNLG